MSESNVELARRGYEAIARGDVDAVHELHPGRRDPSRGIGRLPQVAAPAQELL